MLLSTFNKQAKNLKKHISGFAGVDLPLSRCQELLARVHGYPSFHAAQKALMQPDVPSPIPTRPAGTPKQIADQLMAWADSHAGNPGADYYANENRYALEAIIGALQFLDVPYDNPALALLLTDASALQALLDEAWQKDPEEKGAHVLHSFCGNYRGKNGVIDERELRGIHGGLAARLILSVDREFGK